MSLILDALNKADRQRDNQDAVPSLASHEPTILPVKQNSVPLWALIAIIALLFAVVLVLVLMLFRSPAVSTVPTTMTVPTTNSAAISETAAPMAPVAEPIQPSGEASQVSEQTAATSGQIIRTVNETAESQIETAPVREPLENQRPAAPRISAPAISAKVAAIYAQVGEQNQAVNNDDVAQTIAELYKTPATSRAAKPSTSQPPVSGLRASELRASESQQKAEPRPKAPAVNDLVSDAELAALWQQTQNEVKASSQPEPMANTLYANIPFLYQLPESFQTRIPTLMYQNHIYSPRASAVILNGTTYRKGDTIAPNLVIDDVTEDGIVLNYLNRPFRLAALSSWVKK